MLIYRCDRCGHELTSKQIVGKEFTYMGKFESLTEAARYHADGKAVIDVCKPCFDVIGDAYLAARRAAAATERAGFLERVKALGRAARMPGR